jgi:NADH-quinone oxidoreductase subunit H
MYAVWLERKVSGRIQGRLGPMEVGWFHGWLQTLADGVKLMAKEDLIPATADKVLFILAPIIAFTGVLLTYLIVPFHGSDFGIIADLDAGLYFFAAVASVEAIGIIMAGWASNNKWSLFGTMRTATQVVSYELPIGLCFLGVVAVAGSLQISTIVTGQAGWFWHWSILQNPILPLLFIIYIVAQLAETKRAPFDLPEAESELVAGFHTEYSSMRFSLFFLSEYASMYVVAVLAAVMFLGGWFTGIAPLDQALFGGEAPGWVPVVAGSLVMISKATLIVFVQIWVRWTYPRVRLDPGAPGPGDDRLPEVPAPPEHDTPVPGGHLGGHLPARRAFRAPPIGARG